MSKIANKKAGTVYALLDARKPLKGTKMLPVKLSLSIKGKQFLVGLKLQSERSVFDKAMSGTGTVPRESKQFRAQIDAYITKAQSIIDKFPNYKRFTSTTY